MKPYDDISERISMDPRTFRRLSRAVESTIAKFMAREVAFKIPELGDAFMLRHPALVRAAVHHLFDHWFEEVNYRHTDPEKAAAAVEKVMAMMEPYAKTNPHITLEEVMKLEDERILAQLEESLNEHPDQESKGANG